ncbi:natural killer cell receptor 2B4 [Nannospalax galili]|uniref:natural killer cell receptor 2B4 n=1 Tax=Nannospalax galili TaxID=1026970 RepID=UPI00111C0F5F|nr:natural killer cell receptor 2B4 [Nannospalax galili]
MLSQAVPLVLFLLFKGHQGQECPDSTEDVAGVSGSSLCLRPYDVWIKYDSFQWKKRLESGSYELLTGYNFKGQKCPYFDVNNSNNTFSLNNETLTFLIKSAKPQDSGHYFLEVTNSNGQVCTKHFMVLVLDHVEKPHLQVQWKTLDDGMCEVSLYCLVYGDDNVSYALYRGSTKISTEKNFTHQENQTDVSGLLTYTCNVSNHVSWESHTLNFTQGCLSVPLKSGFLPLLVVIIILVALFLGVLICCYVWDKRRQSQSNPEEFLTVYEDVKDQVRRNQPGPSTSLRSLSAGLEDDREQRRLDGCLIEEQKPPGEGTTIYSMIQCQPSASTPQETTSTLYSVIQPFKKSGSKKNHSPSFNCTVYEEVGKRYSKAYNPARLSRKELENFDIYP